MALFFIIGIILTSLAWIGDVVSWAWLGNGFTLDIILFLVAIILTILLIIMWKNQDKTSQILFGKDASTVPQGESGKKKETIDEFEQTPSKKQSEKEPLASSSIPQKTIPQDGHAILFTCPACGAVIDAEAANCPSCGSERPVCIVCLSDLRKEEEIVITPCCRNYAHSKHLENWLEVKGYCPSCLKEINQKEVEAIRFEDE
ncbi:MAG: hypothetical protein GF308_01040 [Candidatus Heimdallarchaeota archaeon]|nr:hypothetical protein [Candidatus Heimdallarchaeota archaeon]